MAKFDTLYIGIAAAFLIPFLIDYLFRKKKK